MMINTNQLSQKEVRAKYAPTPYPRWTPEVEAKFFTELPKASRRNTVNPHDDRVMLIREFAKESLNAQRMSDGYFSTLGSILGKFASADEDKDEFVITQRKEHLGTARTIRTIQAQMHEAGYLVREKRTQGHGFVGDVFIYSPRPVYRYRKATLAILEQSYRDSEGETFSNTRVQSQALTQAKSSWEIYAANNAHKVFSSGPVTELDIP